MRMKEYSTKMIFWALTALMLLSSYGQALAAMHRFSGNVIGLSGRHKVYVSLWNDEKWGGIFPLNVTIIYPEKIRDGAAEFSMTLADGEYAITVFEDANGNGKLDYDESFLGQVPAEPYAFFRPKAPWFGFRWPDFKQVSFKTNRPEIFAKIRMKNRIR